MCMSIEYHLYLLHFFNHENDYNLFIIYVFMFMGGSMPAVMLLLCYLPMTMIIITLTVGLCSMYNNCISNIFVVITYMNHVSQYNSFLLSLFLRNIRKE